MEDSLALLGAVIASLCAGSQNPAHLDALLVVESHAPTTAVVNRRLTESRQVLVSELKTLGYAEVKARDLQILISEDVWQDKKMKADLAQYDTLQGAIRPDGTVDLAHDPDLLDMARSLAGQLGYDVGQTDTASLVLHRKYTLQIGDRTVDLDASTATGPWKGGAGSKGLRPLAGEEGSKHLPKNPLWMDDDLTHVGFYAYFGLAADRGRQRDAYQAAIAALAAHFREFNNARKSKSTKLNNRIGGFDVSQYYGKGFSDLPSALQQQLLSNNNFKSFGFQNSADFLSWISQGTLTGSQGGVSLALGMMSNGVGLQLGIP